MVWNVAEFGVAGKNIGFKRGNGGASLALDGTCGCAKVINDGSYGEAPDPEELKAGVPGNEGSGKDADSIGDGIGFSMTMTLDGGPMPGCKPDVFEVAVYESWGSTDR